MTQKNIQGLTYLTYVDPLLEFLANEFRILQSESSNIIKNFFRLANYPTENNDRAHKIYKREPHYEAVSTKKHYIYNIIVVKENIFSTEYY